MSCPSSHSATKLLALTTLAAMAWFCLLFVTVQSRGFGIFAMVQALGLIVCVACICAQIKILRRTP